MKSTIDTRLENAECHYNGLQDEKGLDLLRECVKSILDEERAGRDKRTRRIESQSDNSSTKGVKSHVTPTKNSRGTSSRLRPIQ